VTDLGFMAKLPPWERAEYPVGIRVVGVGWLYSGWPDVRGVLVTRTDPDPYVETKEAA